MQFPKLRMAYGAGDLIWVYDVSIAFEDGAKAEGTIRQPYAGVLFGTQSVTIAFKSKLPKSGFERDYMSAYRQRREITTKYKITDSFTLPHTGYLTKPNFTNNVDGFIDFSVSIIGNCPAADLAQLI